MLFTLSCRHVEDLLAERGPDVSTKGAATGLEVRTIVCPRPSPPTPSAKVGMAFRLDGVVIAGRQFLLWRAVDDEGEVLDLLAQRRRDKASVVKLMRELKETRFRT